MKPDPAIMRKMLPAVAIGIELGASVVVGAFIGYTLDKWLGTKPYFFLFWLVCGFAAGIRSFFRVAKKLKSDETNTLDQ